ncbi:hypothetical protein DESC_120062 [Desulfosarcina cetonica]|nr:hypothetical protein DESC_120062 [Desulfosarcina cetonica]
MPGKNELDEEGGGIGKIGMLEKKPSGTMITMIAAEGLNAIVRGG